MVNLVHSSLIPYLGLEEVLGTADPDLLHVDFALLGQGGQARVLLELAGRGFAEDEQELPERDEAVLVLVDLLDHGLQSQVGLRCAKLLHHDFELLNAEPTRPAGIVPEKNIKSMNFHKS